MDKGAMVGEFCAARKEMEVHWRMLRSLHGGTQAMRESRDLFLPRDWRERKDPLCYEERLQRSWLYGAYPEAIESLASRPFQRPVSVDELPTPYDKLETDADRCGTSLTVFAYRMLWDMWDRGFGLFLVDHVPGTIVDRDEEGNEIVRQAASLAEEDSLGVRPYFCRIDPDNVVGWRHEERGGHEIITELRVRDWAWEANEDWSETLMERIRVWNAETFEVWERPKSTTSRDAEYRRQIEDASRGGFRQVVNPKPHGFPGGKIPLVVAYAVDRLGPLYCMPPKLRLAELNVEHWQSMSQQKWILHYARAPLLRGRGMTHEEVQRGITLGAGATALSTDPQFDLAYVEPTGSSLEAGRKDLEDIETRMRAMGLAPFVAGNGPDTATGQMRDEIKEQSAAQRAVEALEWALWEGYKLAHEWRREELSEDFRLNIWRDFNIAMRTQQDLATLESARSRKDLSLETYLRELQDRRVINADVDIEEEMARIEDQKPDMAALFGALPTQPGMPGEETEEEEEDEEDGEEGQAEDGEDEDE